jgi:uncharacterized repeat protein (TIGR03803 family)
MIRNRSRLRQVVGSFIVAAALLLSAAPAHTQTETVLYSFKGITSHDGSSPVGGLVFDKAGNLYGTTLLGGNFTGACSPFGCGIVFQLLPASGGGWNQSVIHFFAGRTRFAKADGAMPESGVVFDARGNLYGTAVGGDGTVFELSPATGGLWNERLIHAFSGNGSGDGSIPSGGLVLDAAGNLFGTTQQGGSLTSTTGTVFELARTSQGVKEELLYSFLGGSDGAGPQAGLLLDSTGNLYGTTVSGGDVSTCAGLGQQGCGVVFKLSPMSGGGWQETVLHTFSGGSDGAASVANLIMDASGNLYGTTSAGGDLSTTCFQTGCGVVFELSPDSGGGWTETVLHTFGGADGSFPMAGLAMDSAGNLYGTTLRGGNLSVCGGSGCGGVFELSPKVGGGWTETVLHKFGAGGRDGINPQGGVILDAAGNLYGTTRGGGDNTQGTVFKISR